VNSEQETVDWVAAYNDLRWLLMLERASRDLTLSPALTQLLADLYGQRDVA
jgi:hypothetical protein